MRMLHVLGGSAFQAATQAGCRPIMPGQQYISTHACWRCGRCQKELAVTPTAEAVPKYSRKPACPPQRWWVTWPSWHLQCSTGGGRQIRQSHKSHVLCREDPPQSAVSRQVCPSWGYLPSTITEHSTGQSTAMAKRQHIAGHRAALSTALHKCTPLEGAAQSLPVPLRVAAGG